MLNDLGKISIFANLSLKASKELLAVAHPVEKLVGEMIFFEKDCHTPVYFVIKGGVRIFRAGSDGKEQNLAVINEGEAFNLPTAFFLTGMAPASAAAVCSSRLLSIKQDDFRKVVSSNPEIALAVLSDLSLKLEKLTDLVHDLSLRDVRGRLAKFLLQQHINPDLSMRWTHERIASQIGTSREVVSRLLKIFTKEGLVEIDRSHILVKNTQAIKKLAE